MKALKLVRDVEGAVPRLELSTVPKPTLIPKHVLVKVHASAIQPSDVMNAKGLFPQTQYPRIVGRDYAGVIEDGPQHLIGLEVFGSGGGSHAFTEDGFHAEYCLAHEAGFAEKPKKLSFAQAATLGVPLTAASLAITRAAVKSSDVVLVIGANGSVGSSVVQMATNIGARVLKAARNDSSDVNTKTDPTMEAIDRLTNGRGIDVIIDTVGLPEVTRAAMKKLARGGRLAFIAAAGGDPATLSVDMRSFYRADLTLCGCNTLNLSVEEMAEALSGLQESFESGHLIPGDVWTPVPLDNAIEAYEKLISGTSAEHYVITMV